MKISLDKAYFGIMLFSLSYSNRNEQKLETYNLFNLARVKWSVATYVAMSEEEKKELSDPLHFCFGDVWCRCEYEYLMRPVVSTEEETTKTDVYNLYVVPNAKYLMEIVNSISVSSAKEYLQNERKRLRGE